jgi:hypothetical protein
VSRRHEAPRGALAIVADVPGNGQGRGPSVGKEASRAVRVAPVSLPPALRSAPCIPPVCSRPGRHSAFLGRSLPRLPRSAAPTSSRPSPSLPSAPTAPERAPGRRPGVRSFPAA